MDKEIDDVLEKLIEEHNKMLEQMQELGELIKKLNPANKESEEKNG